MLHFKICPKCVTGAIYEHEGLDGPEKKCVTCAYTVYVDHSVEGIVTDIDNRSDLKIGA